MLACLLGMHKQTEFYNLPNKEDDLAISKTYCEILLGERGTIVLNSWKSCRRLKNQRRVCEDHEHQNPKRTRKGRTKIEQEHRGTWREERNLVRANDVGGFPDCDSDVVSNRKQSCFPIRYASAVLRPLSVTFVFGPMFPEIQVSAFGLL